MPFNESQQQLNQAQAGRRDLEIELLRAKERLANTGREKSYLSRFAPDEAAALADREKSLAKQVDKLKTTLASAQKAELKRFKDFLAYTDPREHISRLDDRTPILLFPLRIETRFKTLATRDLPIPSAAAERHELWVRIYPDDAAIDSFEPLMSENEVRNAASYNTAMWAAFGDEGLERAAWRSLVASHGSGRAYWISQNYPLENPDKKPVKANPDDIVLIIATELLPAAPEKNAIDAYWKAVVQGQASAWEDLVAAVGEERAEELQKRYKPANLPDTVPENPVIEIVYLHLPDSAALGTKLQGWLQTPRTHILPERLVLMAFNDGQPEPVIEALGNPIPADLAVGPDPSLGEDEQIHIEDGNLVVNEEMAWIVDFEQAVAKGMGFKVSLSPGQAKDGFDRLYVLGVRMAADSDTGKQALETLIEHHHHSRKGFGILRQGTPTNNTDDDASGYSWQEDSDQSFDLYFKNIVPADPQDWISKRDGRWLAEILGINPATLQTVDHYFHTDQQEARAINHALWPATLGYFMQNMMEPVFADGTVRRTRDFFTRYVSGRGAIPLIRVGKQPYGILPATPFRRMGWIQNADKGYLHDLYQVLNTMSDDWAELIEDVSHVGRDGDPHQLLLDIVGLSPASVEFYSRNAQSLEQLYNTFNLLGFGGALIALLLAAGYVKSGMDLLEKFGYTTNDAEEDTPEVLSKFFFGRGDLMTGPVIDDVPLSETAPIRAYAENGRNYIEWLIEAANTSHDTLRQQQGFSDNPPAALLYLMLHHALDLGYVDTSLRLQVSSDILTDAQMATARREPEFIHIQEEKDTESRWRSLYAADPRITGHNTMLVGEYIPSIIAASDDARQLRNQLAGLEVLKDVPTARLERLFTEHLDLCTYRLDAWIQGLVHYQLERMRHVHGEPRPGIYIGTFGWLENIRPENKILTETELPPDLATIFDDPDHPLMSDSTNGGYIHAPSTNHAVTAAVLRNGYLENASSDNPDSFAVNLSSERIRLALSVIEGMQAGQSLAALLGYQLERGLHDRHNTEVDGLIYNLRLAFPLSSNRLNSTKEENLDSIDSVEARNVVDALALIEHIQQSGNANYPFDHPKLPDSLSTLQKEVIDEEVERILNINDAVADLAIAESVHQVTMGNYDRAAATLDTYSKGNFPPTPEVIKTPRSGVTLTHRVGLQLEAGLDPSAAENKTPRATAEPAINKWLNSVLPVMDNLACLVEFTKLSGDTQSETVTLQKLDLLPIDALYMVNLEGNQEMTLLDDAINLYIQKKFDPALDSDIIIRYTEPVQAKISLHEAAPLLRSLKALVLRSRSLTAGDVSLMNETNQEDTKQNTVVEKTRITLNRTIFDGVKTEVENYANALEVLIGPEDVDQIIAKVDDLMLGLSEILQKMAMFGLPQSGSGFIWQWQQTQVRAVTERLKTLSQRLQDKLDGFDETMLEYQNLPAAAPPEERFALLQTAERFISTKPTDTSANTPDQFRDKLMNSKRPDFEQLGSDAEDVIKTTTMTDFYKRLTDLAAAIPDFDTAEFDIKNERELLLLFAKDLLAKGQSIKEDLQTRLEAVDAAVLQHDNALTAFDKSAALLEAGKQMFGEEFKIIPEFSLSPFRAAEWQSAYDDQAQLLSHQVNTLEEDFPVDNWLYGVARVREKIGHVENATVMTEIIAAKTLTLEPLQLPYRENDSWLALEYPQTNADGSEYVIDEDKLLYTAHYAVPFDAAKRQCGLLFDEWTEIIPGETETTGLTFHYDRPNSEPPQTLLLVTPADFTGQWQWNDLVDTLHDTLDLAKKRAVEPDHIDRTAYARFLPALVSAFTVFPITASLNLALNNQFYLLKEALDE